MPWLHTIGQVFQEEFADLVDVSGLTRLLLRLLLAGFLSGLLGLERERKGKPAGIRTHMLVCVGAALFVMVPQQMGMPLGDMSRIIQGVTTGIGFLGAGAILKTRTQHGIHGLTTAAGIWLTAALGVVIGLGRGGTAILTTLLAWIILSVLVRLEDWLLAPQKSNA